MEFARYENRRQAIQDFEDLIYYWPSESESSDKLQEVIDAGLMAASEAGHAMTEKGQAFVERKRRLDPNYEADLSDFNRTHLRRRH